MQNNANKLLWGGVLIAIVIATVALFGAFKSPGRISPVAGSTVNGGNVVDYDAVNTLAGYWVNGSKIIGSAGIVSSLIAQFDAGIVHSYTNSTSTLATTYTLTAADISNYESVLMTPNIGALTLTLPASSTLAAFVPSAGDWADQCWYNATGTAAATITFVAGTGIDLEVGSSTNQVIGAPTLTIGAGNSACLRYFRKPATASTFDIVVQLRRFIDGD